jgi:hypothetical protein
MSFPPRSPLPPLEDFEELFFGVDNQVDTACIDPRLLGQPSMADQFGASEHQTAGEGAMRGQKRPRSDASGEISNIPSLTTDTTANDTITTTNSDPTTAATMTLASTSIQASTQVPAPAPTTIHNFQSYPATTTSIHMSTQTPATIHMTYDNHASSPAATTIGPMSTQTPRPVSTAHIDLTNSPPATTITPSGDTPRRSSRPAVDVIFNGTQLAPMPYIKLNDDVHAFMINTDHPERLDIIGTKRRIGSLEAAKNKLHDLAEQFVSEGAGENFYAPNAYADVPNAPVRTMFWPQNYHDIVRAIKPIMRKVVTNERARVYQANRRDERAAQRRNEEAEQATAHIPAANIIFKDSPTSVKITVNIMRADPAAQGQLKRILPRLTVNPQTCQDLAALRAAVKKAVVSDEMTTAAPEALDVNVDTCVVKVLVAEGLTTVGNDNEWLVATLIAEGTEWLEGEVKVLMIVQ